MKLDEDVPGQAPADLVVGPITRTTLGLFAGASHDHTPLHIDIDFARAAGHDDVFAHGMYVMANMARLVTAWRSQKDLIRLKGRFLEIVQVGDILTYSGRISEIRPVGGERHAELSISVTRQDGRHVMSGEATIRLNDRNMLGQPNA
ncbi:acyl dehydratase [Rhodoligotrophos appendicifer]|uniref:MaoC/PaaZ C-terminal domain-containing protein n=1 Tax=Rhodoligotrophos appendicifer TaxID=987056 RepID=UPI00118492C6|nr:MaoC/PaaZ C-terminal domain-containing protein [Rhodoligotrophos appendicifer]